MLSTLAIACAVLLAADAPASQPAPGPLPRSSIAAVLAHRSELGLTDGEVAQLQQRDESLQKQLADIRERFAAAPSRPRADLGRDGGQPRAPPGAQPLSPSAGALPEGMAGAGHRGGVWGGGRHGGNRSGWQGQDPATRAAALQSRLDDADTAAWLSAETVLAESRREKARDVAEKYREELADQREAERQRGAK